VLPPPAAKKQRLGTDASGTATALSIERLSEAASAVSRNVSASYSAAFSPRSKKRALEVASQAASITAVVIQELLFGAHVAAASSSSTPAASHSRAAPRRAVRASARSGESPSSPLRTLPTLTRDTLAKGTVERTASSAPRGVEEAPLQVGRRRERNSSAALALRSHPRGTVVAVEVKSTYTAGVGYTFEDVCALGTKIAAGKVKESELREKDDEGKLRHGIPRASMRRWLEDDDEAMRKGGGGRGIKGTPHWMVERDVRGRIELGQANAPTLLGAAEKVIMVDMAEKAAKNLPYEEEEVDDVSLTRGPCAHTRALVPTYVSHRSTTGTHNAYRHRQENGTERPIWQAVRSVL